MVRSTIPAPKRPKATKDSKAEPPVKLTPTVSREPMGTPRDSLIGETLKDIFNATLKRFNYYKLNKAERARTNPQAHIISNFFTQNGLTTPLGDFTNDFLTTRIGSRWGENRTIPEYILGTPQTVPHEEFTDQITAFARHITKSWDYNKPPHQDHPNQWLQMAIDNGHTGAALAILAHFKENEIGYIVKLESLKTQSKAHSEAIMSHITKEQQKFAQIERIEVQDHDSGTLGNTLYETETAPLAPENALAPSVHWNNVAIPEASDHFDQINALILQGAYDEAPELPRSFLALYTRYGNALLGRLEGGDNELQDNIKTLATLSERLANPQAPTPQKSDQEIAYEIENEKSFLTRIMYRLIVPKDLKQNEIKRWRKKYYSAQPSLTETFESAAAAVMQSKNNNLQNGRDYKTIRLLLEEFDRQADHYIVAFEALKQRLLDPSPDDHDIIAISQQDRIELTHGVHNTLTELQALKGFIGCDLKTIQTKINTKHQLDSAITNFSIAVNAAQRTAIAQTVQKSSQHAGSLSEASQKAFAESMAQFQGVLAQIEGKTAEEHKQLPANQNTAPPAPYRPPPRPQR